LVDKEIDHNVAGKWGTCLSAGALFQLSSEMLRMLVMDNCRHQLFWKDIYLENIPQRCVVDSFAVFYIYVFIIEDTINSFIHVFIDHQIDPYSRSVVFTCCFFKVRVRFTVILSENAMELPE